MASADAATMGMGIGLCVLAAPELVMGAVIVVGVVVVGVAIKEALDAYALRGSESEEAGSVPQRELALQESSSNRKPKPAPAGQDVFPPVPPEHLDGQRRPECSPVPVPHAGKDDPHNECADRVPPNRYPGMDVLVGGKRFDALQVGARVLWEIKTHRFDTYTDFLQERVLSDQVEEFLADRQIAKACGYGFVVGVSSVEHRQALIDMEPSLAPNVVVTGCKR